MLRLFIGLVIITKIKKGDFMSLKSGFEYIYERVFTKEKGYFLKVVGVRDLYSEIQDSAVGVSLRELFAKYGGDVASDGYQSWLANDVSELYDPIFELLEKVEANRVSQDKLFSDIRLSLADLKGKNKEINKKDDDVSDGENDGE